jgi:GTPase SAR1 family protein
MSILATAGKPQKRPVAITILGDAGLGKTSLAATFPKPIFIRSEDGLRSVSDDMMPDAFPLIKSVEDLWGQLTALIREEHRV